MDTTPLNIRVWGPNAWNYFHAVTFTYPNHPTKEDMEAARAFFHSQKRLLPCARCREHYTKMLDDTYPIEPHLSSRDTLSRWAVNVHNSVNKRLGKIEIPYDVVRELYLGSCPNGATQAKGKCKASILVFLTMTIVIGIILSLLVIRTITNQRRR